MSGKGNHSAVRTCVIFNPAARGEKARNFRAWLEGAGCGCVLKPTRCAGDARQLAALAVAEGFERVVAAGGDGTVNEVVNGLADAPEGFSRACLGVLPLGTVNVLAREIGIPMDIPLAWSAIRSGFETAVDIPVAEFKVGGKMSRRCFIQMAGAGLDARAIELTRWDLKKKIGALAYVGAGLKALCERKPRIEVRAGTVTLSGELVLVGNGRLYGGSWNLFPHADTADGLLDVCVFPRATLWTLLRVGPSLLFAGRLPEKAVRRIRADEFELSSSGRAPFELDGELAGELPAAFRIMPARLRLSVPAALAEGRSGR